MTVLVRKVLVALDIVGHLLLDGVLQGPACPVAGDVFQDRHGCQSELKIG
jgi:hypothetical protein